MGGAPAETSTYSSLGLVADPFDVSAIASADSVGIKLSIRAAALRLVSAIDAMADDPEHRPIVVEKANIPAYYHVAALAQALRSFAIEPRMADVVGLYVPIDMMRIGRVRAVLHAAAEWSSSVGGDRTLGEWIAETLRDPDIELDEWRELQVHAGELRDLAARLTEEPAAVADMLFGEPSRTREGSEDLEITMRVSVARQGRLDTDPDDDAEPRGIADEEATDDPMGGAFVTPLEAEETPAAGRSFEELASDYVIAFTRKHLSPVVARGLSAYQAQGTTAMAEEMKITKAPTKTLVALLTYATARRRSAALVFDRFEMWPTVPDDLRLQIVATLTSLGRALKERAGLIFLLNPGAAPEMQESFGGATKVEWDFTELPAVESVDAPFDARAVTKWIASASANGAAPEWCGPLLAQLPEGASLSDGVAALQATLRAAADAGSAKPDVAMLSSAMADAVGTG